MKIEQIKIDEIRPYTNNPRKNLNVDKVAESIKQYGFQQPIVVDKDMFIIVGHTRYEASKKLDLKKVPVVIADLPPLKAKAYRIADNRLNEDSQWDYSLLNKEFTDLLDVNYDLVNLGFDERELESIITFDGSGREWLNTEEHWQDMPEFEHDNQAPFKSIHVHFRNKEDVETFFKLVKQDFTDKTKYIWFPKAEKNVLKDKGYASE